MISTANVSITGVARDCVRNSLNSGETIIA